jgi:hypothetical protein
VVTAATTIVDTARTGTSRPRKTSSMNIDIRPIAEQQLPLVVQIQAEAYAAHLQEDEESFFAKYKMY